MLGTVGAHLRLGPPPLKITYELADTVAVLEAGKIVQQGRFDDLCRAPATPWVEKFMSG